jgi:hypothetical protein
VSWEYPLYFYAFRLPRQILNYPPLEHNYDRFFDGTNIVFGDDISDDTYLSIGPGRYAIEMTSITIFDESWDRLSLGIGSVTDGVSDFGIQVHHDNNTDMSTFSSFYHTAGGFDTLTDSAASTFFDLNHFSLRMVFNQESPGEAWDVNTYYRLHGNRDYRLAGSFNTPGFDLIDAVVFLDYECAEGSWAEARIEAVPEPGIVLLLSSCLISFAGVAGLRKLNLLKKQ